MKETVSRIVFQHHLLQTNLVFTFLLGRDELTGFFWFFIRTSKLFLDF